MIPNAIAAKLKRPAKDDFKGRHFEAAQIVQAVSRCLRYPLSSPRIGGFRSFETARRTIQGFEAMLWLRFRRRLTVREQNKLLGPASNVQRLTKG